jgi:S1-C subfamily serine protease
MSSMDFEPEAARCRLFARGVQPDFAFQASGSPKFVAASTGGAAIGYAIDSAVRQNLNFNDCMEARGWRVADGQQPVAVATAATTAIPEQPSAIATLVSTTEQSAPRSPRRAFLVEVADVPFEVSDFLPPHGVMILRVGAGGAGSSAGLQERDVILDFNGSPIANVGELLRVLGSVGPNSTVVANIRRDNEERQVVIHF